MGSLTDGGSMKRAELTEPENYFLELSKRTGRGVYFCRLNGYSSELRVFIGRYYEAARRAGVIIEGKLANPDSRQLAYYEEIMGRDFLLDMGFMKQSLGKWLPRMNLVQRENTAGAMYDTLMDLRKAGKNDNILKNAYIKFMCWLYYRFERIVNQFGNENPPKILCDGEIGNYELLLMSVLSAAGCDILLLQYHGDEAYRKADPALVRSQEMKVSGMTAFPADFRLESIRKDIAEAFEKERLYGELSLYRPCTNAWLSGKILTDIREDARMRGTDRTFFYNCFCRINGVEDKLTYQNELYQLQAELRSRKRKLVIVSGEIPVPAPEEISPIRWQNYSNVNQLIEGLSRNLSEIFPDGELLRMARKAFVDLLLEEGKRTEVQLSRLMNKAVYLLCWLKRYKAQLFAGWNLPEIAGFFYLGGCKNDTEALFLRMLARLPVDVLVFHPDLSTFCCLEDPLLYEVNYLNSLIVERYPENNSGVRARTAAYEAEQEMTSMLFTDAGIFRDRQFEKADVLPLQTIYEEIEILWDQELKYRPGFSNDSRTVQLPVIFSKVSGVKNGNLSVYWSSIKKLFTEDAEVITSVPKLTSMTANPMKPFAVEFLKNGRLLREKIRRHSAYRYGILRETMQEHLLDKLQLMLDKKLIRGTFENGMEYTITAVCLNLDKELLRRIQKFDFTKKNPKLIYIVTGEHMLSAEDAVYMTFLHLVGFDVLLFVPTGYQCVEQYFKEQVLEEHQIGEYIYDLTVPDFNEIDANAKPSWRDRIFKRGI